MLDLAFAGRNTGTEDQPELCGLTINTVLLLWMTALKAIHLLHT